MTLVNLDAEVGELNAEIARRAKENDVARRLMTLPGIGPLIATASAVLAPPPETFRKARDFAAWLGLVPRQHSTGGKQRTRRDVRSLRRMLIIGANRSGPIASSSSGLSMLGPSPAPGGAGCWHASRRCWCGWRGPIPLSHMQACAAGQ